MATKYNQANSTPQAPGQSGTTELATTGAPVIVSGATPPTIGQVLIAVTPTTANWQTPAGGGGGAGTPIDATLQTTAGVSTLIHSYTTLANSRVIAYKAQVLARKSAGSLGVIGDSALFDIAALFERSSGGVVTQKDMVFVNGPFKEANQQTSAWNVEFVISGSDIQMKVNGDAAFGSVVEWRVVGTITEHG